MQQNNTAIHQSGECDLVCARLERDGGVSQRDVTSGRWTKLLCPVVPHVMDFSDFQRREAHRDGAKGQSIPRGMDREAESVGAR